jgi:putative ABC transport system permease protein
MSESPETALGSTVQLRAGNMMLAPMEIVGVVENYHFQSLHHAVEPLVLSAVGGVMGGRLEHLLVRTAPGRTADALDAIQAAWTQVAPDEPFTYRFLDEAVQAQYEADQRWATIVRYAVGIALLIACFGLFGLSALAAERRTQEIGIRKALGATARQIVVLLSKEFVLLVGLALVAAVPLAYWAAQRWLQDFAYRIELGLSVFVGAGALALAIALATVSVHALRAARTDPARVLRDE